jgi:hypothetical protein
MPGPEYVSRAAVVADLNARQLQIRASWVERELPIYIDLSKSRSILLTLGVDLDSMARVDIEPPETISLDLNGETVRFG